MRWIIMLLFITSFGFASDGGGIEKIEDLTTTWVGMVSLGIFIIAYYFVAAEEKYRIDKAKPALFSFFFIFMLIGIYFVINGKDPAQLHLNIQHLILEIAEIFFFLFVAMTFIETMIEMGIFDKLKYNLVSKGHDYKKLFWITGTIAFFLSPIADNLTTALILSTVLLTIDKDNKQFLIVGAINIVVAANAGGAWSPFGDVTTLMVWTAGKGAFMDFIYLFPASVMGYITTAALLSRFVPEGKPSFDASIEEEPIMTKGAEVVMGLGVFTIFMAVISHQLFHFPAMWGMMFGLSILKLYTYRMKMVHKNNDLDIFEQMSKVENNTLLFFFGILASVGALYFLGWLQLAAQVYEPDVLGATWSNIGVGFLSSIIDNVPVMSAVIKANPTMGLDQWMLVTLTAGIGGSLISFGSAAGVGVMGKLHGIYTFGSHMKYAWTILIGYIVSIAIWYIQCQVLGIGA